MPMRRADLLHILLFGAAIVLVPAAGAAMLIGLIRLLALLFAD